MKFISEASSKTKILQQQPYWDEKQFCGDGPHLAGQHAEQQSTVPQSAGIASPGLV